MSYDATLVQPMRDELTRLGIRELRTAEEVEEALSPGGGTSLVVINSVCGCAARNARPAVAMAMTHRVQPDSVVTVFAGQDVEATARTREFFAGVRPSSPALALLDQEGGLLFMLERHQIEGREASEIAADLTTAYDQFCSSV